MRGADSRFIVDSTSGFGGFFFLGSVPRVMGGPLNKIRSYTRHLVIRVYFVDYLARIRAIFCHSICCRALAGNYLR